MKRNTISITLLLAGLLVLGACSNQTEVPVAVAAAVDDFPMTVDSCGRQVVFDEQPERVLSVASVAAPLLAAAGSADKIVMRTFEAASFPGEYGPQLADVPLIDPPERELALEEIIAMEPDVVITYLGAGESASDLEAAGIKLLINRGYCADAKGDFEDIFADIELFGRLLGTEDAASKEVGELRKRVEAVQVQTADRPAGKRAVALIFDRDGGALKAYGSSSTVDKQMAILGLSNVFGDVDKRNFEPSVEEIIARDPQVIILLSQGDQTPESVRSLLESRGELGNIAAVRNDDLVVLPFGYTGPSPVAIEGLEIMAEAIR